ncbi:hypothetical protein CRG98_018867 [Punica granatum]|uniref:Uncharacterized protein n=1 Tax=Punica granatum TaxID=22663 RepID=A0A2I0JWR2_PUNGR|nr:hypothetical protein CRG98_018867 [Punica granatum]
MEMKENQAFEAYAPEWRGKAAKHIPPISEIQQVQLLHSTLKGVYYSHLLSHASSFFELIEAGKKLDMGIKLGRIEGLTSKREGEAPKKQATAYARPVSYAPPYQPQQTYYSAPPLIIQPQPPQQHALVQSRAPTSRPPQPVQRTPALQAQRGNAAPSRQRKQFVPLSASLSYIYRQLLAGNWIQSEALHPNFDPTVQNQSIRCEFHQGAPGPTINMISICTIGEEEEAKESPVPFVIEYVSAEVAVAFASFFIEVPTKEPYQDSQVPWNYGGEVANAKQELSAMGITRSGRVYQGSELADKGKASAAALSDNLRVASTPTKKVLEEEAEAFMKVIKVSEYKVVEQMGKSPAHISLLALLPSSKPHRDALLKVLTAAQVPKETAPKRIEETVSSIFSNQISFSEDKIPSEGQGHLRALHIVCKCNNHIVGRVMIDHSSALNVWPVSTLKQMNVDMSRIRASKAIIRAFDGSRRNVNREIDLLIDVGPCSFSVTIWILEIPNAFSLLLRRPRIHAAGAVPSSLHQKLKFFVEGKHITINGEEDYAIYKETAVPYVKEYRNRRGLGFRPSYHEIVQARRGKHLHRLAARYGTLSRGIPVPPLSHFFPGPPLVVGGTSDDTPTELEDSSSDTVEAPFVLSDVYAITEETSSRAPIHWA